MSEAIEFSIIVPVYNVEKYIEKCLHSIYMQTCGSYEAIIVNDGTPDRSRDIIVEKCLYDDRFRLYDKENGGLSSARNEGLDHARGKYVLFLDSDDWLEADYLETISKTIEDETDVLICNYILDDTVIGSRYVPYGQSTKNKSYSGIDKEKEVLEKHLISYPRAGYEIADSIMPVWKNVYRRDLIEQNGLRFLSERVVMAEDYIFNLEAYCHARTVQTAAVAGYVHVIVPGTLSRRYRENAFEMSIERHRCAQAFMEKQGLVKPSMGEAERTHFAFSVADDMRRLCTSDVVNKKARIREALAKAEIQDLLRQPMPRNLPYSLRVCTAILFTKNPVLYLLLYKGIDKLEYLYRWVEKARRT